VTLDDPGKFLRSNVFRCVRGQRLHCCAGCHHFGRRPPAAQVYSPPYSFSRRYRGQYRREKTGRSPAKCSFSAKYRQELPGGPRHVGADGKDIIWAASKALTAAKKERRGRNDFAPTIRKWPGCGCGGLGICIYRKSYAQILGANDRLNFAIHGNGIKGRAGAHLASLKANSKTARVAYVCDVDSGILAKFAAKAEQALGYAPKAKAISAAFSNPKRSMPLP
jgi:hypothetical protein